MEKNCNENPQKLSEVSLDNKSPRHGDIEPITSQNTNVNPTTESQINQIQATHDTNVYVMLVFGPRILQQLRRIFRV